MSKYYVRQKSCAACEWWGGQRETERSRDAAVVKQGANAKGKCGAPGRHSVTAMLAANTCSKFQAWGQLK
jgi:hypothetical protein